MANLLLLGTALFIAFLLGYILRCMFCKHRNGVGGFSGKRLWVLLLAILWGLLSLWWYACKIKNMCDASATAAAPAVVAAPAAPVVAAAPEPVAPPQPPIAFAWSSATAVTTPDFDAIKAKVVGDLPDGKMLHVIGQYYNGEENDSKYPDIGVARAVDAAKLFAESVDENRILVSSENLGDYAGDKSAMLPAVKFGYADMPEPQAAAPAAPAFPLAFGWSSSDPQATADFDAIKARLIGDMGADKALRITGRAITAMQTCPGSSAGTNSTEQQGRSKLRSLLSVRAPDGALHLQTGAEIAFFFWLLLLLLLLCCCCFCVYMCFFVCFCFCFCRAIG